MNCYVCGKGPADGTTVFRQNEKGQLGVWACKLHTKPIEDVELLEITAIIEDAA